MIANNGTQYTEHRTGRRRARIGIMGPTQAAFNNLQKKVNELTSTVENLNSTVENLLGQVEKLSQAVTANTAANEQQQGPTMDRAEIERLVAKEVQAARSSTPTSAVHGPHPAPPATSATSRGFFPTRKQMEDNSDRVENLLVA